VAEQRHSAAAVAERDIKRDAIEHALSRELCGFMVACRANGNVAALGCGPANDHAMKSIVVDDEKARRARRILYALRFSFIRSERLSRHANHLAIAETNSGG
jgi:hypothetical protein